MKNYRRRKAKNVVCRDLLRLVLVSLCFVGAVARADVVNLGVLSYDTFIPAGNGSPGVFAFDISNLTNAFSLPPDFPVTDPLTFTSAHLILNLDSSSPDNAVSGDLSLGDIGPGFLLDPFGNPIVQLPGDEVIDSAEFKATLSVTTFTLSDGSTFTADSDSIDIMLLPSSGSTLTQDVDQTVITASGVLTPPGSPSTIPEPYSWDFVVLPVLWLTWCLYRRRCLSMRFGRK